MGLNLTNQEVDTICQAADRLCPPATSIDRLEAIHMVPSPLGHGYNRTMELSPGLELAIFNETYHREVTFRGVEHRHLVQFMVHLSGAVDSGDFLYQDATQSYIGGSGIQPAVSNFHLANQPEVGVDIHMQPHLLHQLFASPGGELPAELQPLVRGDDWQRVFSPKTTEAMRGVVQQILDCPFLGVTKRLYLQGKVFELMALQLDGMIAKDPAEPTPSLKADTLARVHYAAEILRSHLDSPPLQTELAQRVGMSDRTLRRGFQAVFGTTVLGYLTEQRLLWAEQLLRQGHTVAEVVHRCGYSNQGHFAAAFKRKFGITPKQCAMGRKTVNG
ncbi:helix-turn-helix transcriptional regulator [Nodosilinea sp. PGN35]|uniref:helix-turn-helix transcriptional regulator n=1 Tax=Nodosilinea sp. PGN35 TaxID=3020489 RepID=UPI0023B328B5|nr:AraC family transcriptional regulator [Nodosilinea sp. TSF1-S3]MDF0366520.1 AraC family transcriptional regulator [Nodosilinea sp. TSF1-S3]